MEGYYSVIKERLNLENFSERTVLSIKQDFYATLFLTSLESVLTLSVDKRLIEKSASNKLRQTVNNVVSFNGIKNYVVKLFYHHTIQVESCLAQLFDWCMRNPTYTNRNRKVLSLFFQ